MQEFIQQPKKQQGNTRTVIWQEYDHPSTEEAEEDNFKYKFMRMMDIFKEEIKIPLKKWRKGQTNKWKKSISHSKKPKKTKKKNQTGETNSSRLEDWNRSNKENTTQGNSGYGKSG